MVGTLYPQGDPRRDGAYTIFYMGINLGAFLAPLVCGPLGERIGWGYGFAAAGIGMTLGLLTFVFTQRWLAGERAASRPGGHAGGPAHPRTGSKSLRSRSASSGLVFAALQSWTCLRPIWSPDWLTNPARRSSTREPSSSAILALFLYATEPSKSEAPGCRGPRAVHRRRLAADRP